MQMAEASFVIMHMQINTIVVISDLLDGQLEIVNSQGLGICWLDSRFLRI